MAACGSGNETGDLTLYRDGHFESVQINTNTTTGRSLGISADEADRIWVLREDGRLTECMGDGFSSNAGTATRWPRWFGTPRAGFGLSMAAKYSGLRETNSSR